MNVPASHRGVWYACGIPNALPGHGHVYSGPMATYCAWHRPMAIYCPEPDRTFWVYGNAENAPTITCFDHATGEFAAPVVLGSNPDGDAHRNPTLLIDEAGYLNVFFGAHNDPSRVVRSLRPYEIASWREMPDLPGPLGSYPQAWQAMPGEMNVLLRHSPGWRCMISRDGGESWDQPIDVVSFAEDEGWSISVYGLSVAAEGPHPRRMHFAWSKLGGGTPEEVATKHLWARRYNVYYACSDDGGRTWQRSDGTPCVLPITEDNAELLYDCGTRGVWLKDIQVDSRGNPYILFLDAEVETFRARWMVLRFDGAKWKLSQVAESDHMYDDGALVIIADDDIRIWGPTAPVQPSEDGGEIEEWQSTDSGDNWTRNRALTQGSRYSHNNVKQVWNHRAGKGDLRVFWSYGDSNSPPEDREVRLLCYGEKMPAPREVEFPRQ